MRQISLMPSVHSASTQECGPACSYPSCADIRPCIRVRGTAYRPTLVRSRIRSRSNSAGVPHRWKVSRPVGMVVSRFSVPICPVGQLGIREPDTNLNFAIRYEPQIPAVTLTGPVAHSPCSLFFNICHLVLSGAARPSIPQHRRQSLRATPRPSRPSCAPRLDCARTRRTRRTPCPRDSYSERLKSCCCSKALGMSILSFDLFLSCNMAFRLPATVARSRSS